MNRNKPAVGIPNTLVASFDNPGQSKKLEDDSSDESEDNKEEIVDLVDFMI